MSQIRKFRRRRASQVNKEIKRHLNFLKRKEAEAQAVKEPQPVLWSREQGCSWSHR